MTEQDLRDLLPALQAFHARFHPFFCRTEGRAWSEKYLIGLTLPIERKNAENIAEQVGGAPRKLQEFLSDSPWDARAASASCNALRASSSARPTGC